MLRAIEIAPRMPGPESLEPQDHAPDTVTLPTSETSSGKGEHLKVKKEVQSRLETDDEDSMREKALLVSFKFHV